MHAASAAVRKKLSGIRYPLCPSPQLASFHATPICLAKWKSKWDSKGKKGGPQPSKTYVRYAVRQKRAEIKKALKDYLLYGKSSHLLFQSDDSNCCTDEIGSRNVGVKNKSNGFDNASPPRSSGKPRPRSSPFSGKSKSKFWQNRRSHDGDDYADPETIYEAVFGERGGFRWSFAWENFSFNSSRAGFEWRDESRKEKDHNRETSDDDTDNESTDVGLHLDRITLGLPPRGPLKLDDVKSAFRTSALKWHPDKHQGPSQAMAAEKFRLCVDAYNSLCNVLKAT